MTDNGSGTNSISRMFTVNVNAMNDTPAITGQVSIALAADAARTIVFAGPARESGGAHVMLEIGSRQHESQGR